MAAAVVQLITYNMIVSFKCVCTVCLQHSFSLSHLEGAEEGSEGGNSAEIEEDDDEHEVGSYASDLPLGSFIETDDGFTDEDDEDMSPKYPEDCL